MANARVFTGADGSITLSPAAGSPEGDAAEGVITDHDVLTVGRVQDVRVEVHSDVKPYHEIGQRYATELRPGNVTVRGTIGRAYVNGAMLRLLLGEAADSRPASSWVQPAFNITLLVQNPANPGVQSTMTLNDVKIEGWSWSMPEDDFVMESVSYQALYVTVGDQG